VAFILVHCVSPEFGGVAVTVAVKTGLISTIWMIKEELLIALRWQSPLCRFGGYPLLCKQPVAGSNPVVGSAFLNWNRYDRASTKAEVACVLL
jgi:hypothetical protein